MSHRIRRIACLLVYVLFLRVNTLGDAQDTTDIGNTIVAQMVEAVRTWGSNSSHVNLLQTVRNMLLGSNMDISGLVNSGFRDILAAARQNVSGDCLQGMMTVIQGLSSQETWALRMLDAMGKPPAGLMNLKTLWLGNWQECEDTEAAVYQNLTLKSNLSHPFAGKYCSVNFPLSIPEHASMPPIQSPANIAAVNFPLSIPELTDLSPVFTIGTCMPSTCSSSDVTGLLQLAIDTIQRDIGNITIPEPQVTCQEKHLPFDNEAIIVMVVCSLFVLLMTTATLYDVVYVNWIAVRMTKLKTVYTDAEARSVSHVRVSNVESGITSLQENISSEAEVASKPGNTIYTPSKLEALLLSFSVFTNGTRLLNTSQPKGALTAVNGIRFLSMSWVMAGHGFDQLLRPSTDNFIQYSQSLVKTWQFTAILNGTFSTDTFFVLSGLLVSYLTLKELKKCKGARRFKWGMFYFHRFWRLTPPYMLVILVWTSLSRYAARGPLWPQDGFADGRSCRDLWWTNLLYVNNLFRPDQMPCIEWSWYLANDMQFYIISPLAIIPLYYSRVLGSCVCLALLVTSVVSSGVISWYYDLPLPTIIYGEASLRYIWKYYVKPWCRVGAYAVGMYTGYLLYKTNMNIKIKYYVNVLLWAVSASLGCLVVYGIYSPDNTDPLSADMTILYNATARGVWSLCVAWVIFSCAVGYGGPINRFLSWPGFVPLGRLTYLAYLCHIMLMKIYQSSQQSVTTAYSYGVVYVILGHFCVTYAVSFVLSLAFEAPMMSLEKVLLGKHKRN